VGLWFCVAPSTQERSFNDEAAAGSIPAQEKGMARKHARAGGTPAKGPSQRQLRVGELIRHKIAEMLVRGEIHDDTLVDHVVTVPEVRLSPDLRLATVYVMPLGGEDVRPVLDALDRHRRFIRGEIAEAVNLKFAPDLRFRFDETFDEATRIDQLLDSPKVRQDIEKP
jgi:ribosome-binding factor A